MFLELIQYIKANQFMAAGLSTVALSSVLYMLRSIPTKIWSTLQGLLVTQVNIRSDQGDLFHHLDQLIWLNKSKFSALSCEPKYDYENDTINFMTGNGSGIGSWKGLLYTYYKSFDTGKINPIATLNITLYTRRHARVAELIRAAGLLNRVEQQVIYSNMGSYWDYKIVKKYRPLSTVFVNSTVLDTLLTRLTFFVENEQWYIDRGIPYRFCTMLYGPPGTGKTSLVHAVASKFKFDIRYVTSLDNISNLLQNSCSIKNQAMVVIEDIDTIPLAKRNENKLDETLPTEAFSFGESPLHGLLNSLDGFCSPHGLLVMITTNHPEKLDHALRRAGRIDLALEVGRLDQTSAKAMFVAFFPDDILAWQEIADIYTPITGAQMQEVLLTHDASASILRLKELFNEPASNDRHQIIPLRSV